MTHRGPFQPLPFCDSVKARHKQQATELLALLGNAHASAGTIKIMVALSSQSFTSKGRPGAATQM